MAKAKRRVLKVNPNRQEVLTTPPAPDRRPKTTGRLLNSRLLIVTLVVVGGLAGGGYLLRSSQLRQNSSSLLERADRLEQEGKTREAAQQVQNHADLVGSNLDSLRRLAELIEKTQNKTPADGNRLTRLYSEILARDSSDNETRLKLAEALVELGSHQRAAAEARLLIDKAGGSAKSFQILGDAYYGLKNYKDGRRAYEKTVELEPGNVFAYARLATCVLEEGDPKQATAVIDKMVTNNPKSGEAYYRRYVFHKQTIKGTAAASDLDKAAELEPENLTILLAAAGQTLADKNWAIAKERFTKAVAAAQKDRGSLGRAYLGLGNAQFSMGDRDGAIETWNLGLQKVGDSNLEINLRLADALVDQGRLPEAQQRLQALRQRVRAFVSEKGRKLTELRMLEQLTDYLEARYQLAENSPQKAMPLLASASRRDAGDPEIAFQALMLQGNLYATMEQWDAASDSYQRAAILRPESQPCRMALAKTLAKAGQFEASLGAFGQYSGDPASTAQVHLEMAKLHLQQQTRKDADQQSWNEFQANLATSRKLGAPPVEILLVEAGGLAARSQYAEALGRLALGECLLADQVLAEIPANIAVRGATSAMLCFTNRSSELGKVWTTNWPWSRRANDAARIWISAADAFVSWQKPEVGQRLVQWGLTMFPRSSAIWLSAAGLEAGSGSTDQAIAILDRGIVNLPAAERTPLAQMRSKLIGRTEDPKRAIELLTKSLEETPDDVVILFSLCEQLLRARDFEGVDAATQKLRAAEGESGSIWRYVRAVRLLEDAPVSVAARSEAEQLHQSVAAARPGWDRAHLLGSSIAALGGDTDKSIDQLKKAIKLGAQSPEVYRRLFSLLVTKGDVQGADAYLAELKQSLVADPDVLPFALHISLGQHKLDQAESFARSAIKERPNDPKAHVWLGEILANSSKPAEAEACFRQAISLDAKAPEPRIALIRHLLADDKEAAARKEQADLVSSANLGEKPQLVLGYCHSLFNETELAKKQYVAAIEQFPEDPAVLQSASNFFLSHGMPEADETTKRLLAQKPQEAEALKSRALSLLAKPDARAWQQGLDLLGADDHVDSLRLRSMLLERLGGPEHLPEAIGLLERLVGRSDDVTGNDRFRLANLYATQGRLDEAIEQLLTSVFEKDASPQLLASCVDLLIRAGRWDSEAKDLLVRLEQQDADSIRTVGLRARWLVAAGKPADALKTVQSFLARKGSDAKSPALMLQAANLLVELRQADAAEPLYRKYAEATPTGYEQLVSFLKQQKRGDEAAQLCLAKFESGDKQTAVHALALASSLSHSCPVSEELDRKIDGLLLEQAAKQASEPVLLRAVAERRLFQDNNAEAVTWFRKAMALEPENAVALNNFAVALSKQGEHHEAMEAVNLAIKVAGPKLELLDTKGLVLLSSGNLAGAESIFHRVTADPRASAVHHLHLAYAFARSNRSNESRIALEQAMSKKIESESLSPEDARLLAELR